MRGIINRALPMDFSRTAPQERWALDPGFAVVGAGARGLELSAPSLSEPLYATAYQLELLGRFEGGTDPESLLLEFPFEVERSRRFLDRCRQAGLLRPVDPSDPEGRPRASTFTAVRPRWHSAPAFDRGDPPAFTLLGVPFDGNTTGLPGARFGPSAVRTASEGIRYRLDPATKAPAGFFDPASGKTLLAGLSLGDAGDVTVAPGEAGPVLYARVTEAVRTLLAAGTVPLIVGGDHSLTAPALAAFAPGPIQVVHLDAHSDLGDLERAGPTGLHHGNVFSVVLEQLPFVDAVVQVGLRGLLEATPTEPDPRVTAVGMDALRERGVAAALLDLDPEKPTYVSIDIDVVDPVFAPSTGTPVPNGLFPHELKAILRAVGERFPVVGADLMEVALPVAPSDGTAAIAAEALLTLADAAVERWRRTLPDEDNR